MIYVTFLCFKKFTSLNELLIYIEDAWFEISWSIFKHKKLKFVGYFYNIWFTYSIVNYFKYCTLIQTWCPATNLLEVTRDFIKNRHNIWEYSLCTWTVVMASNMYLIAVGTLGSDNLKTEVWRAPRKPQGFCFKRNISSLIFKPLKLHCNKILCEDGCVRKSSPEEPTS